MGANTTNSVTGIESNERTPAVSHRVGDDAQPSHVVVAAMADARDCEMHELSPLYETIDPGALDDLFGHRHDGTPRTEGRVEFVHGDCEVVVEPDHVLVFCD